jgi:hypothetical protein
MTPATEKHYSASELAAIWGVSDDTIRRAFGDLPGVLKICHPRLLGRRTTKPRVTLRIPASLVDRMHQQWSAAAPALEIKRRGRGI